MSIERSNDAAAELALRHPEPIAHAVAKVIAAWKREGWTPKELHLSNDDWWTLRDELRACGQDPFAFFSERLQMLWHDVRIVANPIFEPGNYRFDPIAPTSVGARMMAALEEFRGGIKRS
jgi:hypothetical protein